MSRAYDPSLYPKEVEDWRPLLLTDGGYERAADELRSQLGQFAAGEAMCPSGVLFLASFAASRSFHEDLEGRVFGVDECCSYAESALSPAAVRTAAVAAVEASAAVVATSAAAMAEAETAAAADVSVAGLKFEEQANATTVM